MRNRNYTLLYEFEYCVISQKEKLLTFLLLNELGEISVVFLNIGTNRKVPINYLIFG